MATREAGSVSSAPLPAGSRPKRRKRYGSTEPRIFTPPLRELTDETSLGFAAVEFARDLLEVDLYPWQEWLLVHGLELAGDLTVATIHDRPADAPIFRFRNVVVIVSRQQGKSVLGQVLSLFFLFVLQTRLILGTAQDLDTAEEVWEGALEIAEEREDLAAEMLPPVRANGKKAIRLRSGERYRVKAANRSAGRGLSGDLILMDELREQQTWDAWGSLTKTTMARPAALIWCMSSAGDATSVVLSYLRKRAHADLGDPDGINATEDPQALLAGAFDEDGERFDEEEDLGDSNLGLFEWSAPPEAGIWDRDGWEWANPSLGYGMVTERSLASAASTDPEWIFRTECMGHWAEGLLEGAFPPGSWEAGIWAPESEGDAPPALVGEIRAAVDVSKDRAAAYIAFGGVNEHGDYQIELVAKRAGTDWVLEWLEGAFAKGQFVEITGQSRGAAVSDLMDDLKRAGLPVVEWYGGELTAATGRFYDAVKDQAFLHFRQPVLDVAAQTVVPKITDGGAMLFDRSKSPVDIGPLMAFLGVHWLLTRPVEEQEHSAYEGRGLMTI